MRSSTPEREDRLINTQVILIHVPKLKGYYPLLGQTMYAMHIPMGMWAIADKTFRQGFSTKILNLGVELIANPNFQIGEEIRKRKPVLVGLDLHWHYQTTDVLNVARIINDSRPETFIVLGGYTASYFAREILSEFPFIDAVIRGDGLGPFPELARCLIQGQSLRDIPNLVRREDGQIVRSDIDYHLTEEDLAAADYTNFRLMEHFDLYKKIAGFSFRYPLQFNQWFTRFGRGRYLSDNAFPLTIAAGCNLNCIACGGSAMAQEQIGRKKGVVVRPLESVLKTMVKASPHFASFYLEYIPFPGSDSYYKDLWGAVDRMGLTNSFFWDLRVIPPEDVVNSFRPLAEKTRRSFLSLSPETADGELRKIYRGGLTWTNEEMADLFDLCESNKIPFAVFFMIGLPGQDKKEIIRIEQTIFSLKDRYKMNRFVTCEIPELEPGSALFNYPEQYGITHDRYRIMDFYQAHNKQADGIYYPSGFSTNSLDENEYMRDLQRTQCRSFCKLARALNLDSRQNLGGLFLRKSARHMCRLISILHRVLPRPPIEKNIDSYYRCINLITPERELS